MKYRAEFSLPGLPKTVNALNSLHWKKKGLEVKGWHLAVAYAIGPKKPRLALEKALLTLTRYSSVEPDFDGLVSSFKPIIDGLIECGVIKNDRMSNIGQSVYCWKKVPAKQGKIHVVVEEIEEK